MELVAQPDLATRLEAIRPNLTRMLLKSSNRSRADVEDAVSHAIIECWRRYEEPDEPISWCTRVARNHLWREPTRRPVDLLEPIQVQEMIEGEEIDLDELIDMRDALVELKPAEIFVLLARVAGLSYEEIQERAGGKTYTWVNRYVTEGRKALRREMAA